MLTDHIQSTAAWIEGMSRDPATVEHARLRLAELLATDAMYAELPALIREIQAVSKASAAVEVANAAR